MYKTIWLEQQHLIDHTKFVWAPQWMENRGRNQQFSRPDMLLPKASGRTWIHHLSAALAASWEHGPRTVPASLLPYNPLHNTRNKRGASALLKHTKTAVLLGAISCQLQGMPVVTTRQQQHKKVISLQQCLTWAPVHLPGTCRWVIHARNDIFLFFCWAAPRKEVSESCLGRCTHHCNSHQFANTKLLLKSSALHSPTVRCW